jgi:hypothetical protein
MNINYISELYHLISSGTQELPARKQAMKLRKLGFATHATNNGFTKLAFDTRRIDQETEYNPRRGLQNYNRSEAFLSQAMAEKLKSFAKLRNVLENLKNEFGREHEWQDSNARVLLSTLNKGLRIEQQDGDFTDAQPAQGSLDYIEELLQVRYRLGFEEINKLANKDLKRVILSKDEELIHKDLNDSLEITKSDVGSKTYDTLMEKLFGNVRATADNPEVERTVTITIKDKFVEGK